mgnify:CR=1 FL=1
MNDFDTFRREAVAAVRVALQWFFLAVPMGLLCGFLGTLFHLAVEHATELRARGRYNIRRTEIRKAAWQRYRGKLPKRLRGAMAPLS